MEDLRVVGKISFNLMRKDESRGLSMLAANKQEKERTEEERAGRMWKLDQIEWPLGAVRFKMAARRRERLKISLRSRS